MTTPTSRTTPRRRVVDGFYKVDVDKWESVDGRFVIEVRNLAGFVGRRYVVLVGTPELRHYGQLRSYKTLAEAKRLTTNDTLISRCVDLNLGNYASSLAHYYNKVMAVRPASLAHITIRAQCDVDRILRVRELFIRAVSSVGIAVPAIPKIPGQV
jgi:hypothetical protein